MTLSIGPVDEMSNIMLSILDVRELMEALFACQLPVTRERAYFSSQVDTNDEITHYIKCLFFGAEGEKNI